MDTTGWGEPLGSQDPRQIGPYHVLGRLGSGGMGRVYVARSRSGLLVAVKTIHAELVEDPGFRVRFAREVAAARRVSGVFTAAVVEADAEAERPWLATAYVAAPSLDVLVRTAGPLPSATVWFLGAGIAEALEAIHGAGLVHRDLKPSNVLVSRENPKVIDFGIVRAVDTGSTRDLTQSGLFGTPSYMSPEQAVDTATVTHAADVYSLGATLLFAATGRDPYSGTTPINVLARLLTAPPDLEGLPDDLVPLVTSCMDRDPERRPTPGEVLEQFEEYRDRVLPNAHGGAEGWLPTGAFAVVAEYERRGRPEIPAFVDMPNWGTGSDQFGGNASAESPWATPPQTTVPEVPAAAHAPAESDGTQTVVAPIGHESPVSLPSIPAPPSGDFGRSEPPGSSMAAEPVTEPMIHPMTEPMTQPMTEAMTEAMAEPVTQPLGQPPTQPTTRSAKSAKSANQPTTEEPTVALGESRNTSPSTSPGTETAPTRPETAVSAPPDTADRPGTTRRRLIMLGAGVAVGAVAGVGGWLATRDEGDGGADKTSTGTSGPTAPAGSVPWVFATGSKVYSSPTAVDGVVYVGSTDGHLYALSASDGTLRWKYLAGQPITSSPAVADGVVYVGGNDGRLLALRADDGTLAWAFPTGATIHSSPAVDSGVIYVGSRDKGLYAVGTDGRQRWRFAAGDWFNSSPTVAGSVVFVACRDRNVYALNAADGVKLWSYTTASTADSSPTVVGSTVFVGSDDKNLYALDTVRGSVTWTKTMGGGVVSSPAVVDGVVYVGSDDGSLYAVEADTGRDRWKYGTGAGIRSSPAVADGKVFVGSGDRSLYAVDIVTGGLVWRYETKGPIDDSSPVVVGGLVVVGSLDGSVHAVDAATGKGVV